MIEPKDRLRTLLAGASRRGEFVLSSGARSDFYIDGKQVTLDAEGLDLIARLLHDRLVACGATAFGGPSTGADPIVGAVGVHAWRAGTPLALFFVRKEAKGYGAKKRVEGPPLAADARIALVEDVVTTGETLVAAIGAVREATAARIVRVFALVDRQEGGAQRLAESGVAFEALFTRADLEKAGPAT